MISRTEKKYINFNNKGIIKVVITFYVLSFPIYTSVQYFDNNNHNISLSVHHQVKDSL